MSREPRLVERGIELPTPPSLPFIPRLRPVCRGLREELGSLDRVERWLKVLVLFRSAPGFGEQPVVASAIGVAELPSGVAVEIEALVALAG